MTPKDLKDPIPQIKQHRDIIDRLDAVLIYTLAERFNQTAAVGKIKGDYDLPTSSLDREAEQMVRFERIALEAGLDPDFAKKFLNFMIGEVIKKHELYKNKANKE